MNRLKKTDTEMDKDLSAFFAVGDGLWIRGNVGWSPGRDSIAGLLYSPRQFVAERKITLREKDVDGTETDVPAIIRSPYTVRFKNMEFGDGKTVSVQGIHNTSTIMVRMDVASTAKFLDEENLIADELATQKAMAPVGRAPVPVNRTISVTLVPNDHTLPLYPPSTNADRKFVGKAFIHWEISDADQTSRTELTAHVIKTLSKSSDITAEYNRKLTFQSAPPTSKVATIRYLKRDGQPLQPAPLAADVVVEYTKDREVTAEVDEAQPLALSCNSDIGLYWVDLQGGIHIVIDNTIIKMY